MKIGFVFRSFTRDSNGDPEVVSRGVESGKFLRSLTQPGDEVVCLIPVEADCGGTAEKMREQFAAKCLNVRVLEAQGHQNSGALNEAVRFLRDAGVDIVFFVSGKAVKTMLSQRVVDGVFDLMSLCGKKAVGIQLPDIGDDVMPIMNTAAAYDVGAFFETKGFTGERCEEVTVLAEIEKKYPNSLILITGVSGELDVRKSEEGQAQYVMVKSEKRQKQDEQANLAGIDLDDLIGKIDTVTL